MGNLHPEYKCGEIFVTKDGTFSWICIICNANLVDCTKFINHVYEDHIQELYIDTDPLNLEDNDTMKPIISSSIEYNEIDPQVNLEIEKSEFDSNHSLNGFNDNDSKDNNLFIFETEVIFDYNSKIDKHEKIISRFNNKEFSETVNDDKTSRTEQSYGEERIVHITDSQKFKCNNYLEEESNKFNQTCKVKTRRRIKSIDNKLTEKNNESKYPSKALKKPTSLTINEKKHATADFHCSFCDKHFSNKTKLKEHIRIHTGERPHKCQQCPLAFAHLTNYKTHILRHSGKKTIYCKFGCGKSFYLDCDRVGHERSHTGEKPFICELCGKHWAFQHQLVVHKRRAHLDRKKWPHKCTQCEKTFITPKDLQEHVSLHTGDKLYTCELCGLSFRKYCALREHRKLHSGVKNYVCKICNKSFAQGAGLYGHMKSHGVVKKSRNDAKSKNLIE